VVWGGLRVVGGGGGGVWWGDRWWGGGGVGVCWGLVGGVLGVWGGGVWGGWEPKISAEIGLCEHVKTAPNRKQQPKTVLPEIRKAEEKERKSSDYY